MLAVTLAKGVGANREESLKMKKTLSILLSAIFAVTTSGLTYACALIMSTSDQGTLIGRTMEWFGPIKPKIAIYPRNYPGSDAKSSLKWVSKYGVLTIEDSESNGNIVITEGINEKGLTAHILVQEDARMPGHAQNKPDVDFLVWVRYVLETNATVSEAIADLKNYQIRLREGDYNGVTVKIAQHYALMDATGDAAVIEFNQGKLEVFHGAQYNVLTNAPNLPEQLKNLKKIRSEKKQYSVAHLPGGADAMNRFVRGSFYMETMPRPDTSARAVAYMEEAIDAMSVPPFDTSKEPKRLLDSLTDHLASLVTGLPPSMLDDAWEARWRVVYDLRKMNVYFTETYSGRKVYLRLNEMDFSGDKVNYIDIQDVKSDFDLP